MLVLAVLVFGGALVWDKLIVPQRPVALLDGRAISLRSYTDALAYRQNLLLAQYEQAQQLVQQPIPPGASGGDDFLRQFAQQRLTVIQNQLSELNTQLVDDLVDERLIRAEATRRGVVATPAEIDEDVKQLIGYRDPNATPVPTPPAAPTVAPETEGAAVSAPPAVPTTAPSTAVPAASRRARDFDTLFREFRRAMAGTDEIVRSDVEMQILRRKVSEQLATAVPTQAEQVHARHILVADDAAARTVLERLHNGETFDALAAELSTDPGSKDKGGDLGWFPRGFMVSAFEDPAFKLQAGETSEPIKTSFGAHIIRVDERESARDLEAEQLQALKNGALPRWLEAEKQNHKVEYLLSAEQQAWAERNGRKPQYPSRSGR